MKVLAEKALVVFRISLSVINIFFTSKLILLSEVLSVYFLVSTELIVV